MKRAILWLALLAPATLTAATGSQVIDGVLEPASYTQISSLSSAVGLGTIPSGVKLVLIQPETQSVRWRDDGTDPTASVGMLLAAGDVLVYNGSPSAIKFIETAASATLNVTFYR